MMHKMVDDRAAIEIENGIPMLVFWLSDADSLPQPVYNFAAEILDTSNTEEACFEMSIPLSGIVDWTIDCHRYIAEKNRVVLGEEDRALIAATRAALQSAIDKLDQIEFKK